jgi:hypothetical protein
MSRRCQETTAATECSEATPTHLLKHHELSEQAHERIAGLISQGGGGDQP